MEGGEERGEVWKGGRKEGKQASKQRMLAHVTGHHRDSFFRKDGPRISRICHWGSVSLLTVQLCVYLCGISFSLKQIGFV